MMALAANLRYRVKQPTDGSTTKEIAFPYLRFLKIKWFNQNCGQWKEVNELAMTVWTGQTIEYQSTYKHGFSMRQRKQFNA